MDRTFHNVMYFRVRILTGVNRREFCPFFVILLLGMELIELV